MKKFFLATVSLIALLGAGCASGSTTSAPAGTTQSAPSAAPAVTVDTTTTYTLADVAKHASDTDCWMAIAGKVYNVTAEIDRHPGGPKILQGCGKDATNMYNSIGKHANGAANLAKFQVGVLK